jgi:hypothetical protein
MGSASYTAPDPWGVSLTMWVKAYDGASSWTFTHSSASSQAFAIAYTGVDATTPIDVAATTAFQNWLSGAAGAAASVAPSHTIVTAGARGVILRGSWDGNPITPPTGWTEEYDSQVIWVGDRDWTSAGATGTVSVPHGNTAVDNHNPWGIIMGALRPSVSATTIQAVPMIARGGMIPPNVVVDTTIAAVPMIARGGMQVLGATISVTIDAVPMIARGFFLPQTPTTDTTIAAVPMIARGVVIPPSVNVSIAAVPMIARGVFIPPSVAVDVTVQLVPMIARAVFIPPSVNVDTVAPLAPMIARGGMIPPRVTVDVTIQAVPMIARGVFIPPSVIADITILAVPMIARGFFIPPRVTGAGPIAPPDHLELTIMVPVRALVLQVPAHSLTITVPAHELEIP